MRQILATAAAAAAVLSICGAASVATAQPVPTQMWQGHQYCWYRNGWHGEGWYQGCHPWRTGYGWAGPTGWNGWGVGVGVGPVTVGVGGPGPGPGPGPRFWGGDRWCWVGNGWHGAGWYRCRYGGFRPGYGWGGAAGWNGW